LNRCGLAPTASEIQVDSKRVELVPKPPAELAWSNAQRRRDRTVRRSLHTPSISAQDVSGMDANTPSAGFYGLLVTP
jgi:hypothetical protein